MYPNLGTIRPGTTIFVPFHTFDSNDPSASVTVTGLAVTDIEVYKDASMTQRASDNGYALVDTDGIDLDGITGIQGFTINTADNSTAGFWAAGSDYVVVVSSITVDAATINFIAARFSIGYPDAVLNTTIATLSSQTSFTLTNGPAEDDALNGCVVCIHDVASAVQLGFAVVSDYTGSTKTVTLTAGTTFTAAATDNISVFPPANSNWFNALKTVSLPLVPTVAGRTLDVSTGGEAGLDWANVGSPTTTVGLSGTTVKTATDVETDTQDIQSALATAQADLDTLTGADGVIIASGTQTFNMTGNITGNLSGSVGSVTGNVGGSVGSVTGGLNTAAGVITTLDGLDTAQDSQHSTTQSAITTVDTVVDAIKAKTDNLPASPADTGDIPSANDNADGLLGRNVAGGSSTGRLVKEALYVLRNKTDIQSGTLTVYGTDDTTPAFTASVSTAAGDPITTIDPA